MAERVIEINLNLGLCNRLRVLCSYYQEAKKQNKELRVQWERDKNCPGHFLDYFKPIEGVSFGKVDKKASKGKWHPDFNPYEGHDIYKDVLIPSDPIQSEVNHLARIMRNDYTAIHVRRTDHILNRNGKNVFKPDSEFFKFLDKTDNRIYLATDNFNTQKVFYEKYAKRITFIKFIIKEGFRHTPLDDAVIDLYLCINAKTFDGTPWSSFTGLIKHIRRSVQ